MTTKKKTIETTAVVLEEKDVDIDVNQLMTVEQLPVITQQLQMAKEAVIERTATAMLLECTMENVKEIKKVKAEITREANAFEDRRKEIKKKILAPYEEFEKIYKDCIIGPYRAAEQDLKNEITEIESQKKNEIVREVKTYFEEYAVSLDLNFVRWEDYGFEPKLSESMKKSKENVKDYLDHISKDVEMINTYGDEADEIFSLYVKFGYNFSKAYLEYKDRKKLREEHQKRREALEEQKKQEEARQEELKKVVPDIIPEEPREKEYVAAFKVTTTETKLKKLVAFMKGEGINYESISKK